MLKQDRAARVAAIMKQANWVPTPEDLALDTVAARHYVQLMAEEAAATLDDPADAAIVRIMNLIFASVCHR